MKIREYRSGDAAAIITLLSANTTYRRDAAFWLWTNRIWPDADSIIVVAEDEGEIVAHYAILPIEIRYQGQTIAAGLGIHALVAPAARGSVPIFQITKRCYQLAKERGIKLLFGFPNQNFRLIQEKVEGWKRLSLFKSYEKTPIRRENAKYLLETVSFSDAESGLRIHDLIEQFKDESRYSHAISYPCWIRRFLLHPQIPYGFHILISGTEDLGVLVSRIFTTGDGLTEGQIVEMVLKPGTDRAEVSASIENHFADTMDQVCLWPIDTEFEAALQSSGYKQTGFETFFGIKTLDPRIATDHPSIQNISEWRLPMAMSDVF